MWLSNCCSLEFASNALNDESSAAIASEKALMCFRAGDIEAARSILEGTVDARVAGLNGVSLLHVAAGAGDAQSCEKLLRLHPELAKASDHSGGTALHYLAALRPSGGREVCSVLIRGRVDDKALNTDQLAAVDLAGVPGGDAEVFKVLHFRKVNTLPREVAGQTPGGAVCKEAGDLLKQYRSDRAAGALLDPLSLPTGNWPHTSAAIAAERNRGLSEEQLMKVRQVRAILPQVADNVCWEALVACEGNVPQAAERLLSEGANLVSTPSIMRPASRGGMRALADSSNTRLSNLRPTAIDCR